ncbi:hypothetical protein [Craterilacuibacter sp. RT1T]|uniref:hypothetical protein n=1 Tax=Craterilacuibacter sp. RT1T TaxID=2942211 RepID=UPI0020BF93C0|nr:hypothetical protein [Craterilacuibacter sp. RT1T]MCL6262845.1 hypothetical protein [Craterilacuibacter sp. RT1T]
MMSSAKTRTSSMSPRARRPDGALRLLFALLLVFLSGCAGRAPPLWIPPATIAIEPGSKLTRLALGEHAVLLAERRSGASCVLLLNVHENESTALAAGSALLARYGGRLLSLQHGGGRLLHFGVNGEDARADPNRIFSRAGIAATLAHYGSDSAAARLALAGFSEALLWQLAPDRASAIITLHNNHPGGYSAASYLPGGALASSAAEVALAPGVSPDQFLLVSERRLFLPLAAQGFNVVLQDRGAPDDGSLSVYAAAHAIPYINVEATAGALATQTVMLEAALQLLASSQLARCRA